MIMFLGFLLYQGNLLAVVRTLNGTKPKLTVNRKFGGVNVSLLQLQSTSIVLDYIDTDINSAVMTHYIKIK